MELPTTPTRQELSKFLPSQRVIRAIEQLFEWIRLLGDPPFGEMYATNVSINIAVAAPNVAYEVTSGLTVGELNHFTFNSGYYLEAEVGAKYLVNWSMAIDTAAAFDLIEGGIMLDGVDTGKGTAHTTVPAASDASTIAGSTVVTVPVGGKLSLYIRNQTAARNIEVQHVSFTAVLLKAS